MAQEKPLCPKCGTERVSMKKGAFWYLGCPKCVSSKAAKKSASVSPAADKTGKKAPPAREGLPAKKKGWADEWL